MYVRPNQGVLKYQRVLRAWHALNQSGSRWTKCGLTPECGSLTPERGSYMLAHFSGHDVIAEGDALILFFDLGF